MPNRTFDVVLERDETQNWVATVPALPGCISQGNSKKQAHDNIREAIALHLGMFSEEVEIVEHTRVQTTG